MCFQLKSNQGVFVEINKLVLECNRKCEGPRMAETVLKTLNNFGGRCGRRASGQDEAPWADPPVQGFSLSDERRSAGRKGAVVPGGSGSVR